MIKIAIYLLLICFCGSSFSWAMTKQDYLILIDNVALQKASAKEIRSLAVATYYRCQDAKEKQQELSETTQRGLTTLIQNGRYVQVLEEDIKASLGKFANGIWVEMPSTVPLDFDFRALSVIKTPESVMLCGKYLVEPATQPAQPKAKQVTGECWTPNNAGGPSGYAAKALQNMGIKNAPAVDDLGDPVIALWQEWFEEVKSGARAISFEGQEVAYRFKPDGSYESLDAKAAESHNQRITRTFTYDAMGQVRSTVSSAAGETTDKETKSDRNWVVFVALFVVLCFTYWFKFRRAGAKG